MVKAPFIKVEAPKFTEVGYVGRDVDSMIRDLVEESIRMIRIEKIEEVYGEGKILVDEKILDILLPFSSKRKAQNPLEILFGDGESDEKVLDKEDEISEKRKTLKSKLINGQLEDKIIEIEIEENFNSTVELFSGHGLEEFNFNLENIFGDFLPRKTQKRRVSINEARKIITNQEAQNLIDVNEVIKLGI